MHEGEFSIIHRHADKGKWNFNDMELRQNLPEDQANLVWTVIKEEFPEWTSSPLKLEGIKRVMKLAEEVFAELPQRSVLLATDSGKDRARFTSALMTARIAQLERQQSQALHAAGRGNEAKRVDMLQVDDEEVVRLLADASAETWPKYQKMIDSGMSESEALAIWLNDMNHPDSQVPYEQHPREAADRQRQFVKTLRTRVTSEKVPLILLGAGHSGGLGQVRYEQSGGPFTADDTPEFCEMFKFDAGGNLVETKKTEL